MRDVPAFIKTLEEWPDLFEENAEIFLTRAPGRLDVMGGIADYSGSLVLEMPIREAALVALQKCAEPTLKIVSIGDRNHQTYHFEMSLADFRSGDGLIEYEEARAFFQKDEKDHWAAYVAGAFLVLMREREAEIETGTRILISSQIPNGKGVSSSAALEVASMKAVAAAFDIEIEPRDLALLCQKVENLVVGAPCGIMDQMSVVCGRENHLLSMVCQPAELGEAVRVPDDILFWGIDSGIRHAVVGADYGSVRTGAFIGYRIIAETAGLSVKEQKSEQLVRIEDAVWNGYLANLSPAEFEEKFAPHLPQKISGADFLSRYGGTTDGLARVSPERDYAVFHPTAHPIYENARVKRFAEILGGKLTEDQLIELGDLMFASHAGYSACGLGSEGTDLLAELVRRAGPSSGLYGAKITGGGSGGTVAVLGNKDSAEAVERVVAEYRQETRYKPYVFSGSSPGTDSFGFIKLISG